MDYNAWIFARGGSKGLPLKNIKKLKNKPLIQWAIEQAKDSKCFNNILVSTDDDKIARVAVDCGAQVPFLRPSFLAEDSTPEWLAWQHAAQWQLQNTNVEGFTSIPTTSPLRTQEDIQRAIAKLETGFDLVLGVTRSQHHPSFNMVQRSEDSTVSLALPLPMQITRRQDIEPAYNITTVVYATTGRHILESSGVLAGNIGSIEIPNIRAIDIDSELDFKLAEFLMEQRNASI